jgi:hypothetical protein
MPVILIIFIGCKNSGKESVQLELFREYYAAYKAGSEDKWNFTADTVKLWFDDKNSRPILQIKGKKPAGKWKEWDEEMNATSSYDSLWFDKDEHSIKGYFQENNDFYELIGKSSTKTLQTYWLNHNNKIYEILIYWIPEENTTTGEHLKPIIEWAMENDSIEIQHLSPDNSIIPSRENARKWKKILERYHKEKQAHE